MQNLVGPKRLTIEFFPWAPQNHVSFSYENKFIPSEWSLGAMVILKF